MFIIQLRNIIVLGLIFLFIGVNSILVGNMLLERIVLTKKRILLYLLMPIGCGLLFLHKAELLHYPYIIGIGTLVVTSLIFKGRGSYKFWTEVIMVDVLYTCSLLAGQIIESLSSATRLSVYEKGLAIEIVSTMFVLGFIKLLENMTFYQQLNEEKLSFKNNMMIGAVGIVYLLIIVTTDYSLQQGSSLVTKSVLPLLSLYIMAIGGAYCILMSHHSIQMSYEDEEDKIQRSVFKKHLKVYTQIHKLDQHQESLNQQSMQSVNELFKNVDENKIHELKPLIEKIETKIGKCKPHIVTGNTMLDMLINEKYDSACKHNIEMKVNISLPEKVGMGTVDLCMLVNNTLDYALERCEHIEEDREKSIRVEGVWYKGYLIFKLYYTIPRDGASKSNMNVTKRIKQAIAQDPYGMGTVMKQIKKYEGEIDLQECGWGEEKLTFSLNATGNYARACGY